MRRAGDLRLARCVSREYKNAVQRIESGERFVTDIELAALADVFNISTDDLLKNDAD